MSVTIRIWADYVCPMCYMGVVVAERLRETHDVVFDWEPFEIRPNAPEKWPLPREIRARQKRANDPLQAKARNMGVELVEHEWVSNSHRAHACTEYARTQDCLEFFRAEVLKAYWIDRRDIFQWDVLEDCAFMSGIEPTAMRESVERGEFEVAVGERIRYAFKTGLKHAPIYVLGDKYVLEGPQELSALESVLAKFG